MTIIVISGVGAGVGVGLFWIWKPIKKVLKKFFDKVSSRAVAKGNIASTISLKNSANNTITNRVGKL